MAKKKNQVPTEKLFTLDDVDEMTLRQFQEGQLRGMYKCHDAFSDSLVRLRQSLEDVWAIEYTGPITAAKQARVDTLAFAINTLSTLEDMFQDEYDAKLDKMKYELREEGKVFTGEELMQYLEDLDNE